jgi:hypothetical protein
VALKTPDAIFKLLAASACLLCALPAGADFTTRGSAQTSAIAGHQSPSVLAGVTTEPESFTLVVGIGLIAIGTGLAKSRKKQKHVRTSDKSDPSPV